jgi:hypothetical protein
MAFSAGCGGHGLGPDDAALVGPTGADGGLSPEAGGPPSDGGSGDAASPDGAGGGLPLTFFAMNIAAPNDFPAVTLGTLGHPTELAWTSIESQKGQFDYALFDGWAQEAPKGADGVAEMVVTLGATPGWAVADQSTCTTKNGVTKCIAPPDNIQDWKDFITALAAHFDGVKAPRVRYYELWNEANARGFLSGTPAQLAALAQAAYPILHAAGNLVLTPSVVGDARTPTSSAAAWMASYLAAGGAAAADGGTFHGYTGAAAVPSLPDFPMPDQSPTMAQCNLYPTLCHGTIIEQVTSMRAVYDANGLLGKPMFNTEGSWGVSSHLSDLSLETAWLARYYALQAGLADTAQLRLASWFAWGGGSAQVWGTIEDDSRAPTAAGVAFNQMAAWLVGTTVSPCAGDAQGTWTCAVTRGSDPSYQAKVVWSATQTCASGTCSTTPYTYDAGMKHVRDLAGHTSALLGGRVGISLLPLMVEN